MAAEIDQFGIRAADNSVDRMLGSRHPKPASA
jgi:hypothetical protein